MNRSLRIEAIRGKWARARITHHERLPVLPYDGPPLSPLAAAEMVRMAQSPPFGMLTKWISLDEARQMHGETLQIRKPPAEFKPPTYRISPPEGMALRRGDTIRYADGTAAIYWGPGDERPIDGKLR